MFEVMQVVTINCKSILPDLMLPHFFDFNFSVNLHSFINKPRHICRKIMKILKHFKGCNNLKIIV